MVLTRSIPEEVTAGRFRLLVASMGHWRPVRPEVRETLGALVQRFVRLMEFKERESYLVVLLPVVDSGGEAFRRSFALTVDTPPSRANRAAMGKHDRARDLPLLERLAPAGSGLRDVPMVSGRFHRICRQRIDGRSGADRSGRSAAEARRACPQLPAADHLAGGGGTHKGPPLYSAGALVAFSWDVLIRDASHGKRDLGDFLRALWRQTDGGQRTYEWRDIQAALNATAAGDWDASTAPTSRAPIRCR